MSRRCPDESTKRFVYYAPTTKWSKNNSRRAVGKELGISKHALSLKSGKDLCKVRNGSDRGGGGGFCGLKAKGTKALIRARPSAPDHLGVPMITLGDRELARPPTSWEY